MSRSAFYDPFEIHDLQEEVGRLEEELTAEKERSAYFTELWLTEARKTNRTTNRKKAR